MSWQCSRHLGILARLGPLHVGKSRVLRMPHVEGVCVVGRRNEFKMSDGERIQQVQFDDNTP